MFMFCTAYSKTAILRNCLSIKEFFLKIDLFKIRPGGQKIALSFLDEENWGLSGDDEATLP